jgi:hypothetical protein
LPSESDAPILGAALGATLVRTLRPKGRFVLGRNLSGAFDCYVHSRSHTNTYDGHGPLLAALVPPPGVRPDSDSSALGRAKFGVPVLGGEEAVAAVLLLRLFAQAAARHLFFDLDFRPAAERDKRYRLILHATSGSWLYLHAPSFEQILRTGLDFMVSEPKVAHRHP